MSILKEFRDFAIKGNAVDLAIGVIIGGAFGGIVSSLVSDIIMPPLGLILQNVNFKDLALVLQPASETHPEITLRYGMFIQQVINFIIVALAIFVFVKLINKARRMKEESAATATPSAEEQLLTEIRDLLKQQKSQ